MIGSNRNNIAATVLIYHRVPSYSVRAQLDLGLRTSGFSLGSTPLRAGVRRGDHRVHVRTPAIPGVERGARDLEAVGLSRKGPPCGNPLDEGFYAAQCRAKDRRRELSITPHCYSSIVI